MKTIVFIDETARIGGAEINLIRILPRLKNEGWNPIVLIPEEGPLTDKLFAHGVSCRVVRGGRFYSISSYVGNRWQVPNPLAWIATSINGVRWAFSLKQELRQIQPNMVQTVSMLSHLFGGWAARSAGFPVVSHVQDLVNENSGFGLYYRLFQAWAKSIPSSIVCISDLVRQQFAGNPTALQKTRLILNLVDVDLFQPGANTMQNNVSLRLGTAARITQWKGQHIALRTACLLRAKGITFSWEFVGDASMGDASYAQGLYEQVQRWDLGRSINFIGWKENISQFYRSLDILVHLPSEPEPFGLVIAEALSSGLPVVTTHGGLDEIVEESGGLLVPANDPSSAVIAILNLVSQIRARKNDVQQRARSSALRYFSPVHIMPQWLSLYNEVSLHHES